MRFLSASYIYPVTSAPVKNGIVAVDSNGIIQEIIDPSVKEFNGEAEYYEGIICPGFVNAHCHLELSHLKGQMSIGGGLTTFIDEIISKRKVGNELILAKAIEAENEMHTNGIVAVGDICNSDITIEVKKNSKLYYHSFIEVFDLVPDKGVSAFANGISLLEIFKSNNLKASLSPHASYTVSNVLFELIAEFIKKTNNITTIHNQESPFENEMFESGTGKLFEQLVKLVPEIKDRETYNDSSLNYIFNFLPADLPLQLVHNTFTHQSDLINVNRKNLYWCLCPAANLYIENKIPDIKMLANAGCKFTIGTDSYASNHSLSIIKELKIISKHYPEFTLEEFLKWSTLNGADFLGISKKFGSIEKGKTPGLVHISSVDLNELKITEESIATLIV